MLSMGRMEGSRRKHSNLQSFIAHTTPLVPVYSLPKTCVQDLNYHWQAIGKEKMEYFTLTDLWDQYSEWSAYGAGVPITLDNHESVVQYYVPYLSAIQIYTYKSLSCSRIFLEENVCETCSDDSESDKMSKSCETCSDDSESDKMSKSWDASSEDSVTSQGSSSTRKDIVEQIYLHYVEYDSPYRRVPLADKVNELAQHFPGLMSFKSVDVSPASWMSVAWYPIYHIPTRRNVKDLSACFLTFHTISASVQDIAASDGKRELCCATAKTNRCETKNGRPFVALSPFGLSTYKMQGSMWRNPKTSDNTTISTLYNAAQSWLKQHRVEHQDFDFFSTH